VLGGGPIGLEMSQAFARLGSRVTVVEFMDQILGPEDSDLAEILKARMELEGVAFHVKTRAVKAESDGSVIRLTVASANGSGTMSVLEGDALLVAAGRKPNVEGLGLGNAGIEFTSRAVPTDLRMRTNISHIFACGDVNGTLPFTHVAGYEGGIALTNAVLRLPRKADYSKIGWCTYTDPEVASIGLNEKRAKKEGVPYHLFEEKFEDNDRALAEGESLGKIKILVGPKGKLLGCQIIGSHAGELIHEWIIAMGGGVKLSTMAGAVHVYPTKSEISKRVAGDVFTERIFGERTKSVLRLLFSLKGRACSLPEE
jgi:pyruvate/2-oxoglutarate dehydrogenase complex dihydrolipoamide dehydrogenase (E3) component